MKNRRDPYRNPYDLTDRFGPARLAHHLEEDQRTPLAAVRSPAFWASVAIVLVLVYLAVTALH
jgi:hypothetical protein